MGVSPTNPKQQAAIPFFGHTEILHMLVSMCSTALAAAVVLPRYGGVNHACGINEDWKRKNVTLQNIVQCSCKNIEQKCFIYHQISVYMATERVTENVWLAPALMDDVTE